MLERQVHHLLPHFLWNPVPELPWIGPTIDQPIWALRLVPLVPAIEGAAWHLQLLQRAFHRQGGMLHQMNDLALLRLIPANHSSHLVSLPSKLFFKPRFLSVSSATNALSCSFSLRSSSTSWLSASRLVSPTN